MNKKILAYLGYLVLLFWVEVALWQVFSASSAFLPHLVLLFVIIFALTHSFVETLWVSFFAGFLKELFSGSFFGGQICAMVLAGLVVYFVTRNLTAQEIRLPTMVFLVIFASLIYYVMIYLFNFGTAVLGLSRAMDFGGYFHPKFLWAFLLNIFLFLPLRWVSTFLPK